MSQVPDPFVVYISTPLAEPYVERIRAVAPNRVEVLYEPDLLPPQRYSIDHTGEPDFTLTSSQEERWKQCLGRAHGLWGFPPAARDGTPGLSFAPNVRWIQTTSSGIGQRVKSLGLQHSDIIITNAAGVHAGPLAEFVFLTLLTQTRRLDHLRSEQEQRHWQRFVGDELEGKTLAIVGAGSVGRRVAEIGQAFGMRVVALASPGSTHTAEDKGVDELFAYDRLHEMLGATDALVLIVPHTPDTEGLMDAAAFDALKDGAVLVNIARGPVVDEAALVNALRSGKVSFAGLDVFQTEPLPPDHELWTLPNVLISPHSSANADSENGKITHLFCHNLACILEARPADMRNVFNKARLY